MHIRAFGIVSHHPIRYEVKLDLFKSIDASTSFSKHEGVGTMIFNLTKLEPNGRKLGDFRSVDSIDAAEDKSANMVGSEGQPQGGHGRIHPDAGNRIR